MKTRFICIGLTAAVMLTMSQSVGQPGRQNDIPGRHRSFHSALSPVGRVVVAQTPVNPNVTRLPQDGTPRFVPQGVRHRVPADYLTIQAAINASSTGDTVLVSEGTYKENIRYRGKAITVASLYLIDGDTTHIAKTIIDGSSSTQPDSGSVVYFINGEDTTSVLCGFTIQGGSGTRFYYSISPWFAWQREGGGIYCLDAGARIVRNIITRNRVVAQVAGAGGIEALGTRSHLPYLILEANRIRDNYVEHDTSSTNWWGWAGGADVEMNARVVNNVFERDSVVGNSGAYNGGMGLLCFNADSSLPSAYIAGNVVRSNFVFSNYEALAGGMGVFGTGNVTILNNTFQSNAVTCSGILAQGGGLCVDDGNITGFGRKMIVGNSFVNNTIINSIQNEGGGLQLIYTLATVSGNKFVNNVTGTANATAEGGVYWNGGAGISMLGSSYRLENNILTGNVSGSTGGALLAQWAGTGTEQTIVNNTIVNNHAAAFGGGLNTNSSGTVVLLNDIFWNDTATSGPEIYNGPSASTRVVFCDVKGEFADTGNINVDPKFADTTYRLSDSSKCIGAGADSLQISGVWYRAPGTDFYGSSRPSPAGSQPDIGACENSRKTPLTGVSATGPAPPSEYLLQQNYPNPFNPNTIITFELPRSSVVKLSVYDMLGREVSVLVNERKNAGSYEVKFDGSGLASGVYFYRIQAGSFVQTRKLLLIR